MDSYRCTHILTHNAVQYCFENGTYGNEQIPMHDIVRIQETDEYTLLKYRKHETKNLDVLNEHQLKELKKKMFTEEFMGGEFVNYRSLVFHKDKQTLLSFTPPKSIPESELSNPEYEEFVEGTMISVFYNPFKETWELATRSIIGGRNGFNKNTTMTFRKMFLDAMTNVKLEFEMLNSRYCYTFVIQHPHNRVVVPFNQTRLYLVGVYEIVDTSMAIYAHELNLDVFRVNYPDISRRVNYPKKYVGTREEIIEKYASEQSSYDVVGVIARDGCKRATIRNPVYERIRRLRGNQPKLQYQYFVLRQEGKVRQFLKHYPELKKKCSIWREQLHSFTSELYRNYVKVFIEHSVPIQDIPFEYKPHVIALHEKYMNDLKPKGLKVSKQITIQYVNTLHPSRLMFALNSHIRKQHYDAKQQQG